MKYLIYIAVWIITGIAVVVAINVTRTAVPLWALFIPAMINIKTSNNNESLDS